MMHVMHGRINGQLPFRESRRPECDQVYEEAYEFGFGQVETKVPLRYLRKIQEG